MSRRSLLLTLGLVVGLLGSGGRPQDTPRAGGERRLSFNEGWRFFKGEAPGAERPGFDDSSWRQLDLPHDWAIEGPFDEEYGPSQGALPYYRTGWYRKSFTLPAAGADRYYSVEFDGAMANSRVWLNGVELGGRPGLVDEVDIAGFNYAAPRYAEILEKHRDWYVLGAETASTVSSRGVYHLPIEKYQKHPSRQITSYDIIAPPWAYAPDVEFVALDRSPAVLGEFVWTGFDYLGEPTPYYMWNEPPDPNDWPARSSYFGIVDLAGFPKDRYYLYQSRWTSEPMVHILPHWNWEGHEGGAIPVNVYTNAEEVELRLNGASLGRKRRGRPPVAIPVGEKVSREGVLLTPYRMVWAAPWEPGTLRAVAYDGGREVAATEVHTAAKPARIALVPDRTGLAADGQDLSFITVRIEDDDGNLCPRADNLVRFEVEGAGRRLAVGNGNPSTLEPFQADERRAFNGLALLIAQSERDRPGTILIEAHAKGLRSAQATLTTTVAGSGR